MKDYDEVIKKINCLNKKSRHDNLILAAGMYYDNAINRPWIYPKFHKELDSDQLDYFRFRVLELLSQEVKRLNLPGVMAEVGVYQGDFSSRMNALLPSKKLYLFDTFSGFKKQDILLDMENGLITEGFLSIISEYTNTCIETVLQRMKYREQCIVKPGYFPESLNGLNEVFCLVSIDVDLYQPTLNALDYFYPRLCKHGYIMVHDYNHDELMGVKKAVHDYEKRVEELILLPIPDQCGTVIITK